MKTSIIKLGLLLFIGASLFSSCEKSNITRNRRIEGEWTLQSRNESTRVNYVKSTVNSVNGDSSEDTFESVDSSIYSEGVVINFNNEQLVETASFKEVDDFVVCDWFAENSEKTEHDNYAYM